MNKMLRRRPRSIAAIAAGAAAVLLMGGLVAMTSDSIRSQGNNARSGEYTPPAHDLQIAVLAGDNAGKDCATAAYSDADVAAVFSTSWMMGWTYDPENFTSAEVGGAVLCLKNAGNTTGQLIVSVDNLADQEVDNCAPGEADLGKDLNCAAGQRGELSDVFTVGFRDPSVAGGNGATCATTLPDERLLGLSFEPAQMASGLPAGAVCEFFVAVVMDGGPSSVWPTPDERVKYVTQTDRTTWDFVFTLQDAAI